MLNWQQIDTVLVDMDGTLLDLHFDNYFWQTFIVKKFAAKQNIELKHAESFIFEKYQQVAGQLNWYCLDYWQKQLQLPIKELKYEIQHLIKIRDDVPPFLNALKQKNKRIILVTNAHPDCLAIKLERTKLNLYIDEMVTSHQYGYAKEDPVMWQKLERDKKFEKARTLFIDDNIHILDTAKQVGIGQLLAVENPDSRQPAVSVDNYFSTSNFRELIPELTSS